MSSTFSSKQFQTDPHLTEEKYQELYKLSINHPEKFWVAMANELIHFEKQWQTVFSGSLNEGNIKWFEGAELNVCYNCVDRHLATSANKIAMYWQGDNSELKKAITYQDLYENVCKMANILKKYGVKKGDRVCIYLPMIPEAIYAMLASARIGAIHTVVFSGFSPQSLAARIDDAKAKIVITADSSCRAGKMLALKNAADEAINFTATKPKLLVVKSYQTEITWHEKQDIDYFQELSQVSAECPYEIMAAEDPLFILYTSGSTGNPKGVVHTQAGYITYVATTFKYVFNHHPDDVFWCSADIGWITGHSYIVYGPFVSGATSVIFEGVPNYPDASRLWQIIDEYKVNTFYTAPTLVRMLMREGEKYLENSARDSLRLMGTVGEPINPAAWQWFYQVVGKEKSPIVDTWWQTETGGIMITPLPNCGKLKPGSATRPFFGIEPALLDDNGDELLNEAEGNLVIKQAWPSMLRTVFGDHQRYLETYLNVFENYYFTGDSCYRDKDGDYWIRGRIDDVINVSGHRLGTAEIESAIVKHPHIAEAAVVGVPDEIKGQGIYAFITPMKDFTPTPETLSELNQLLRKEIGPIAKIDHSQFCQALPKTRSGKIMRRILRKIASNDFAELGDTSTLADDSIIQELIENRKRT